MSAVRAYLDTCIVSGLAKDDLAPEDVEALLHILEARKAGLADLFTSKLVQEEISKIPPVHRARHSIIYGLLTDIPLADTHHGMPPFTPAPMFRRKSQVLTSLERLLPDAPDAAHVFQASEAGLPYLVTVDRRTLLNHAEAVFQIARVRLVSPVEFARLL